MKEWHRTVILTVLLALAVGVLLYVTSGTEQSANDVLR